MPTWCGRGGSRQAEGTGESGFHADMGAVTWMRGVRRQGSEGCGSRGQWGGGKGQRGLMEPGALRSLTSQKKLVESPLGHMV